MKVVLRKEIEKLGKMGDIVSVKDGYARNYLIPREYAFIAKAGSMKRAEFLRRRQLTISEKLRAAAQELAVRITDLQVSVPMKVGEENKLYGSVNAQIIAQQLEVMGHKIEKSQIILEEPIKTLGTFDVRLKLHPEVYANVKVWVIKEGE